MREEDIKFIHKLCETLINSDESFTVVVLNKHRRDYVMEMMQKTLDVFYNKGSTIYKSNARISLNSGSQMYFEFGADVTDITISLKGVAHYIFDPAVTDHFNSIIKEINYLVRNANIGIKM